MVVLVAAVLVAAALVLAGVAGDPPRCGQGPHRRSQPAARALPITPVSSKKALLCSALRLRVVDRVVAVAGLAVAVAALAPMVITTVLALASDVAHPTIAGTYNQMEPRGDDLLFLAVAAFALVVAPVQWRVLALLAPCRFWSWSPR